MQDHEMLCPSGVAVAGWQICPTPVVYSYIKCCPIRGKGIPVTSRKSKIAVGIARISKDRTGWEELLLGSNGRTKGNHSDHL